MLRSTKACARPRRSTPSRSSASACGRDRRQILRLSSRAKIANGPKLPRPPISGWTDMPKHAPAALLALTLTLLAPIAAPAQTPGSWPDKPIRLIVPFPPGGPIDTMARVVAHHLSAALGQQVIVEDRPGAGSTLGTKSVAIADPDGYTLLFGS